IVMSSPPFNRAERQVIGATRVPGRVLALASDVGSFELDANGLDALFNIDVEDARLAFRGDDADATAPFEIRKSNLRRVGLLALRPETFGEVALGHGALAHPVPLDLAIAHEQHGAAFHDGAEPV